MTDTDLYCNIQSTFVMSTLRISRHSGYVDVFVKSRILSLYILYTFIPYKSTFHLSRHVFRSQTMFSHLIVCLDNHCIHNASCENRDPCVFAGQILHHYNKNDVVKLAIFFINISRHFRLEIYGFMLHYYQTHDLL